MQKAGDCCPPRPYSWPASSWRHTFFILKDELKKVFKKHIKQGQVVFKEIPAGNEHVVRALTSHFVIDVNIVCNNVEVHRLLTAVLKSDTECAEPCQCLRRLLNISMTEALSRQKDGHSKERILHNVMAGYMEVSRYDLNLPAVPSAATSPAVSRPSSAADLPAALASVALGDASVSSPEDGPLVSGLQPYGGSVTGGVSHHSHSLLPSSQHQPSVRVEQDPDTPVLPGMAVPLVFHNGIQAGIAAVLQHSAGLGHGLCVVRSSIHPSYAGVRDTVTVRACPEQSKNKLVPSQEDLMSILVEGSVK